MGWKLALAAHKLALGDVLSLSARSVLDCMCWSALDSDTDDQEAAVYWGGHYTLEADLLGSDAVGTERGKKAIQRALRELTTAGLIEQLTPANRGRTAQYRVNVKGWKRSSTPCG